MNRVEMQGSGIFFDSADLHEFGKWLKSHTLGGATTNPVIFEKAGVLDVAGHIRLMVELAKEHGQGEMPISVELPDADWPIDRMVGLAIDYTELFPENAVIKVPMKPDEPEKAFEVVYRLGQEGIRTNATIGLSMGQLIGAAEAGRVSRATGENYISLFWGRRDEAKKQMVAAILESSDTVNMSQTEIAELTQQLNQDVSDAAASLSMTLSYLEKHSLNTRVIVGSIRNVHQIERAFALGADIVTIPPKLLNEWMYTDRGMETVDQFNQSYRQVQDKIKLT